MRSLSLSSAQSKVVLFVTWPILCSLMSVSIIIKIVMFVFASMVFYYTYSLLFDLSYIRHIYGVTFPMYPVVGQFPVPGVLPPNIFPSILPITTSRQK